MICNLVSQHGLTGQATHTCYSYYKNSMSSKESQHKLCRNLHFQPFCPNSSSHANLVYSSFLLEPSTPM